MASFVFRSEGEVKSFENTGKRGALVTVRGSISAGKTTTLIRLAQHHRGSLVLKSSLDDRYHSDYLATHDGTRYPAQPIARAAEALDLVRPDTQVVIIDEVQFFGDEVLDVLLELRDKGCLVITGSVDHDHLGDSYMEPSWMRLAGNGSMTVGDLIDKADIDVRLAARCSICGNIALRFKRVISGDLGPDDPYIWVGGLDLHKALCKYHFEKLVSEGSIAELKA